MPPLIAISREEEEGRGGGPDQIESEQQERNNAPLKGEHCFSLARSRSGRVLRRGPPPPPTSKSQSVEAFFTSGGFLFGPPSFSLSLSLSLELKRSAQKTAAF